MGQSESKLKGSFTFAYLINNPVATTLVPQQHILQEDDEDEEEEIIDYILKNPEVYGLSELQHDYPFYSHHHQQSQIDEGSSSFIAVDNKPLSKYQQNHRDSGLILPYYNQSIQIINDLSYIDTTYYYSNDDDTNRRKTTTNNRIIINEPDDNNNQISFTDVLLASPDNNTLHEVYLSCRSILRLSPNIGMLTMIRKLDLSNNHLTELPESTGYMQSLESLILTRNQLKSLPDTIGYLSNLVELDLSFNSIQEITPCISYLSKLKTLSLAFNQISFLPVEISGLCSLISIDLTRNLLTILPAEISQLPFLRRIRLDDCPFESDIEYPLKHNPPSLVETCARIVKRMDETTLKKLNNNFHKLPEHMINYIQSAKSCTFCLGPYYESAVLRGRLMEKTDMHIPLQYTLCSAHWSNADDRILSMFSAQPSTSLFPSSQVIHHQKPLRPNLPSLPKLMASATTEKLSTSLVSSNRKLQSTALPLLTTESNVTFDTSAIDDITNNSNNNQLFPSATTAKLLLNQQRSQITKSTIFNSLTSKLKRLGNNNN